MALSSLIRKSKFRDSLRQSKEFENNKDSAPIHSDSSQGPSCQLKSTPLEDPNFRFKLFDNLDFVFDKYPFLKARKEDLNVDIWRKEQIQEAFRQPECKERIEKQLTTVCQRSYLSNVFEEESYLSNSYLKDLFLAVVEENDPNTDILMVLMPESEVKSQSINCGDVINVSSDKQDIEVKNTYTPKEEEQDFGILPSLSPNTAATPKTPNLDNKTPIPMNPFERLKSGSYVMAGLMITSYGYNLCACLPLELKDKYITLDILCSRQGTRGIGSLMMSSLLLCAYEHHFTMIGLQVASSTFKSLTSKRLKRGTNIEACLFYENFGFFYDNRPRDVWFCFDPESSELTTMLLDMEKYANPGEEIVEICKKRLTKEGSSIPEKKIVLPAPSVKPKAFVPTQWQGRRISRKRPADYEMEAKYIKRPKAEEEEEPVPSKAPRGRGKQPMNRKIEAGKKVEFILQSMQQVLSDGTPRSAKQLLEILRSPPFSVDFQAEKPLNTLTSILSKETIHFKKTTITRVPNSLPLLYTLKEFLGTKGKSRKSKSVKAAHSKSEGVLDDTLILNDDIEAPSVTPYSTSSTPSSLSSSSSNNSTPTPPPFQSPNEGRNFIVPHEINIDSDTKLLESENSNGNYYYEDGLRAGALGNPLASPPMRSIEPHQYLPTSNVLEFGEAPLEPLFENMETEPTPKLTNSESNTPTFRSPEEVRKIGEDSPGNSPRNPLLRAQSPSVIEAEIKNLPPNVCNLCREKTTSELVPYMDYKICRGCAHRLVAWKTLQSVKKNPKESSTS